MHLQCRDKLSEHQDAADSYKARVHIPLHKQLLALPSLFDNFEHN